MAKRMQYKEFEAYALKHYEKGGDTFFECWDEKTFFGFYPEGITKSEALELFRKERSYQKEIRNSWM